MTKCPKCPYCDRPATFAPSSYRLYSRDFGPVWECLPCRAYVGCHKATGQPLGTPANAADRALRKRGHARFDTLWRQHGWNRGAAYVWLAKTLAVPEFKAHFGRMNGDLLQYAVKVAERKVSEIEAPERKAARQRQDALEAGDTKDIEDALANW